MIINKEPNSYIRMNIYAFFSKCALREERTVLLRVNKWAFFISIVAVWPMSTPDSLFIILVSFSFCMLRLLQSDIVLVVTEIDNRICRINFNFLKYRVSSFLEGFLPLILSTFWVNITSSFIGSTLLTYSIKHVSLISFISFTLVSFI